MRVGKDKITKQIKPEKPSIKHVKRKIHFYELLFDFNDTLDTSKALNQPFIAFFTIIAKMAKDKESLRYQDIYDAKVFVQDVLFDSDGKYITGKFRHIKMDVFPEILNTHDDTTRDIEALEVEGIVETTHFVINLSNESKFLALEYNHAGAKFSDFIAYCEKIGQAKEVLKEINENHFRTLVRDEMSTFEKRINAISSFSVRVHKNNISKIESIDKGIYTIIKSTEDQFDAEYLEIFMKFNIVKNKKYTETQPIRKSLKALLNYLTKNKEKINLFDTLKTSAQDSDNNLKIKVFDLLSVKVESEIPVQLKPKYKVIVSEDILLKIKNEFINNNI